MVVRAAVVGKAKIGNIFISLTLSCVNGFNLGGFDMEAVIEKSIVYEKPRIVKETTMRFPIELIMAKAGGTVCKQCSSCHGCR